MPPSFKFDRMSLYIFLHLHTDILYLLNSIAIVFRRYLQKLVFHKQNLLFVPYFSTAVIRCWQGDPVANGSYYHRRPKQQWVYWRISLQYYKLNHHKFLVQIASRKYILIILTVEIVPSPFGVACMQQNQT